MVNFRNSLISTVALIAATFTCTATVAATAPATVAATPYIYNAKITITAPKGTTAETAAKNKTLPVGVKFSTCAVDSIVDGVNIKNQDFLNFSITYDAGKLPGEIGDVFLILQNLTENGAALGRYFLATRINGVVGPSSGFGGGVILNAATNISALDDFLVAATQPSPLGQPSSTFLAAVDNLGGSQTEILFGGNLNLTSLPKGLWAMTVVIAKPNATYRQSNSEISSTFMFSRPETWAAHDTVVFELGTPFGTATTAPARGSDLINYAKEDARGLTPQVCQ